MKQSTVVVRPSISAYTVSVGDTGSHALYASYFDVFQTPYTTAYQLSLNFGDEDAVVARQTYATATAVGRISVWRPRL